MNNYKKHHTNHWLSILAASGIMLSACDGTGENINSDDLKILSAKHKD